MTDVHRLAQNIDEQACLDTLAEMVQHKSYSETEGERTLALRMVEIMSEMGLEAYLTVGEHLMIEQHGKRSVKNQLILQARPMKENPLKLLSLIKMVKVLMK